MPDIPDDALCYPPAHDDDYRLCAGATNNWLGTIEDRTGREILDLSEWAARDFPAALEFARLMVREHNQQRFGICLPDY